MSSWRALAYAVFSGICLNDSRLRVSANESKPLFARSSFYAGFVWRFGSVPKRMESKQSGSVGEVQQDVNLIDLVKSFLTTFFLLQESASIQLRASLSKSV